MDHWQSVLRPERHRFLPRTHGNRPHPTPGSREFPEGLAAVSHAPWWEQEPTAAVAKRGQVLVQTGAILHSAWREKTPPPTVWGPPPSFT